jgi:hypothetical protein
MRRSTAVGIVMLALFLAADARAMQKIGEEIVRRVETQHPYRGELEAGAPRLIREETFHHEDATYIALHFARFQLADGDYMIVRSPDGLQSWRYEGLGRAEMGLDPEGFWAVHIKGDTAIVELHAGLNASDAFGLAIDRYARGYTSAELLGEEPGQAPNDVEAICGADDSEWAKCYEDTEPEIYDKARAVSRLLINGSFTCTGWLLGCEGHLMTNNHCISSQATANNTDYEFMGESSSCSQNCFSISQCPGPIAALNATLVRTNGALDYTLLKLPGNPSSTYGFMVMREAGPIVNERIYLPQHAAGWGKRIAVFSTHPQDQSGFCEVFSTNSPPCTGGPGDIGYYADTQGGSSGAPVLAYSDHKVVSLHHCANCPNRGLDTVDLIASIGADLPACATEELSGTIEIDAARYRCTDTVTIEVRDDSLAGETSHPVSADSPTEGTGETVLLVPAGPGSGIFLGALQLVEVSANEGDGELSVTHGDTVTITYIDEDDGQGGIDVPRVATAEIDCLSPVISNIVASDVGLSTATIQWTTDEPSTSRVTYGEVVPPTSVVADPQRVTSHLIDLAGLVQCRSYSFLVSSVDDVGNEAHDDNGGAFHTFETGCTPPPEVPAGAGETTMLTVKRIVQDGSQVQMFWGNQCVFPPSTAKILYGPLDQVSDYTIDGSVCSIPRLANPKLWSGLPAGNLWFVMSGDNSFGHESSWGTTSAGEERGGPVASGECATFEKNLSGTCP